MTVKIRLAIQDDVDALLQLENQCFDNDRLSKRRFKYWVQAEHGACIVAIDNTKLVAYGLLIFRQGTRSARLYSLAVSPQYRGQKIAQKILLALEETALERQRLFVRLEVAKENSSAIRMYQYLGYKQFGIYKHYYEDGGDALRFQKSIKQALAVQNLPVYPWFQQSTEFTCGPCALMMAMSKLDSSIAISTELEIDIWRQATTVFMTSGHGGCHPLGLALAANTLGFKTEVFLSQSGNLFVDGVRSEYKKSIMQVVEKQFEEKVKKAKINIHQQEYFVSDLERELAAGHAVICLISTYQFDSKKTPHWVAITHIDDSCLYFHDPDASLLGVKQAYLTSFHRQKKNSRKAQQNFVNRALSMAKTEERLFQNSDLDYQHVPIIKEDFAKLSAFGKSKLRTCIVIKR